MKFDHSKDLVFGHVLALEPKASNPWDRLIVITDEVGIPLMKVGGVLWDVVGLHG